MTEKIKTIAVFGASGQTGQAVIKEAQAKKIKIIPVNRLGTLTVHADAVGIVFGPRPPFTDIFCAETTKNIIKTMKRLKINRLICQTGAMIGDYRQNRSFWFQLM